VNLRQLEVFHAIIKAGSVTGAARDLCVTQPAVSAVLKHTEQQLRMKLFERIGGRLHPTPEALALLPDVNDIFGRVQAVQRVAQELRDGRAGQLVVATSPTLVNALLPEAVAALRKLSPQLGIYVRSLPTPLAIDRVSRREADMGVVYAPVEDPAVDTTPLAKSEIACVVRKDHPLASRRHVDARDLGREPVISLGASTRLGQAIAEACKRRSMAPPAVGIEASSSLTACLMVKHGAGVALVDRLSALPAGLDDLVFLPFRPRIEFGVVLVYPRDRPRSLAATRLADLLADTALRAGF